jgi:hypothetical protein
MTVHCKKLWGTHVESLILNLAVHVQTTRFEMVNMLFSLHISTNSPTSPRL